MNNDETLFFKIVGVGILSLVVVAVRSSKRKSRLTYWHYQQGNHTVGPVASGRLQALVDSGEVSLEQLCWTDGMPEWRPISEAFTHTHSHSELSPPSPQAPHTEYPQMFRRRLTAVSILEMIGLYVVTLHLYFPFWLRSISRVINGLLPSNRIPSWYFPTSVFLSCASLGWVIPVVHSNHAPTVLLVWKLIHILDAVFILVWTFKVRNRVHIILNSIQGSPDWFDALWTFLFQPLYLQLKFNRLVVSHGTSPSKGNFTIPLVLSLSAGVLHTLVYHMSGLHTLSSQRGVGVIAVTMMLFMIDIPASMVCNIFVGNPFQHFTDDSFFSLTYPLCGFVGWSSIGLILGLGWRTYTASRRQNGR